MKRMNGVFWRRLGLPGGAPLSMVLLLAAGMASTDSLAARHALLVGVGNYPGGAPDRIVSPDLEGPAYDLAAMTAVLQASWQVPAQNITVLKDQQATKAAILQAIRQLYQASQPGDELLLYFTGHGTSAKDLQAAAVTQLETGTGAFVTYDSLKTKEGSDYGPVTWRAENLLVGKRDLRPALQDLDRDRQVLVIMDSCFSGNAVRSAQNEQLWPSRNLRLPGIDSPLTGMANTPTGTSANESVVEDYPYQNVFFISAAGENEPANDIPTPMLARAPTVDGKPHGAFTDMLLRVLKNPAEADTNHDQQLQLAELHQAARHRLAVRGFDHQPVRLPTLSTDSHRLGERSLFGQRLPPAVPSAPEVFALQVPSDLPRAEAYRSQLKEAGITLDDKDAPLRLVAEQGSVNLMARAGEVVARSFSAHPEDVTQMVADQYAVWTWMHGPIHSDFNVYAEMTSQPRDASGEPLHDRNGKPIRKLVGGSVFTGNTVGFAVSSPETAYLAIISVDAAGKLSLIYPLQTPSPQPAGVRLQLDNLATVVGPAGRDQVLILALKAWSPALDQFKGQQKLALDSAEGQALTQLLQDKSVSKGLTWLTFYTKVVQGY